ARQRRRTSCMTTTNSGRKKVTTPSRTVTGRRRISRSTRAAADWTSSVTPIAVACAYTARSSTMPMPSTDRTSSRRSRGRWTRDSGTSTSSTFRRGAPRVGLSATGVRSPGRSVMRPSVGGAPDRPPEPRSAETEGREELGRQQGVADEGDDVEEGVGEDAGHGGASPAVVLREDAAHRGVRQPRARALVEVVGAAQERARGDDGRRPPAELLEPLDEVAGRDDLLEQGVLQRREDEDGHGPPRGVEGRGLDLDRDAQCPPERVQAQPGDPDERGQRGADGEVPARAGERETDPGRGTAAGLAEEVERQRHRDEREAEAEQLVGEVEVGARGAGGV